MNIRIFVATTALSIIAMTTPTLASNVALTGGVGVVTQVGNNNQGLSTVSSGNLGYVYQQGDANLALMDHFIPGSKGITYLVGGGYPVTVGATPSRYLPLAGTGNAAVTVQIGQANNASIDIGNSSNNSTLIEQVGNRNTAAIAESKLAGAFYSGSNFAQIVQYGNQNKAGIGQEGLNNTAAITQGTAQNPVTGDDVTILQTGANNFSTITQTGSNDPVHVTQHGNNLFYTLNETGSNRKVITINQRN